MNIPLVDLKAQYIAIQQEIDEAISTVIRDTAFIGGPYLKTFEKELHSEIEKIIITDELPSEWTYPLIQPKLLEKAEELGY